MKDKALGAMLGHAVGDALGYQVEFDFLPEILSRFGREIDFSPGQPAEVSDDTQMGLAVAEGLIASGTETDDSTTALNIVPRFIEWMNAPLGGHRAPGRACLRGCARLASGVPWFEAGGAEDGGCGAVMRSVPYGLRYWDDPNQAATMAASHARMTHRHPMGLASSAALASGIALAVRGADTKEIALQMEKSAEIYHTPTAAMLKRAYQRYLDHINPDVVFELWQGWAGHEAVAAGLFAFLVGMDRPNPYVEAVRLGATTSGDSDSIACIAGALAGARLGVHVIPPRWLEALEFRDLLASTAIELYNLTTTKE